MATVGFGQDNPPLAANPRVNYDQVQCAPGEICKIGIDKLACLQNVLRGYRVAEVNDLGFGREGGNDSFDHPHITVI